MRRGLIAVASLAVLDHWSPNLKFLKGPLTFYSAYRACKNMIVSGNVHLELLRDLPDVAGDRLTLPISLIIVCRFWCTVKAQSKYILVYYSHLEKSDDLVWQLVLTRSHLASNPVLKGKLLLTS